MTPLDAALAACRFAHDGSTIFLFGTSAYVSVLVPAALRVAIEARLRLAISIAIVLSAVAAILALALQAGQIVGSWAGTFDLATLQALVLDTQVGHVWQGRMVLCLLLLLVLALPPSRRLATVALISGLLLASLALVGHAAMRSGPLGSFQRANDALHMLSGGAWLGALIPLLLCLSATNDPERRHVGLLALRRFSTAGHVAVTVVIMTGIVSTGLVLGRWPTDLSSPYQALLTGKILAVGAMVGLALANRYALMPRFAQEKDGTVRSIRSLAIAEVALGALVLALVSVFGMLEPR